MTPLASLGGTCKIMPGGIIVHGPIGAGKTLTCLELVKKARASGLLVEGIVSPRAFEEEEIIGYDCLSVATMKRFPLVRIRERAYGKEWFTFSNIKYYFSSEGFE
ncbi:MAG: nucleoside-triphosphatase, partial [Candidatus Bathyarchaeota archaeon]